MVFLLLADNIAQRRSRTWVQMLKRHHLVVEMAQHHTLNRDRRRGNGAAAKKPSHAPQGQSANTAEMIAPAPADLPSR